MELGLLLIFWYGVLHAFGPDHLAAIADFSIGKSKKKTFLITFAFAIGHGVMLFIFAKILEYYSLPEYITDYGDIISSSVIIFMGIFIIYMLASDQIQLKKHTHEGKEHIHIWFGKNHEHDNTATASAFTIGALMGLGGVRGMLVTLGMIEGQAVDLTMVLMFVLGVSVVFLALGVIILFINQNLLHSIQNVKKVFASVGVISIIVGTNMLFSPHSHAMTTELNTEQHGHQHQLKDNITDADQLVNSKEKSDMTYKQIMQRMGEAYNMIQRGILNENEELVKLGASMIDNHPAPKQKPWSIVKKEDQQSFKQTLISYNTLLHQSASNINNSLKNKDWHSVNKEAFMMSNHCISCHQAWKNNTK